LNTLESIVSGLSFGDDPTLRSDINTISGDLNTLESIVSGLSFGDDPTLRSDINTISGDLNTLESIVVSNNSFLSTKVNTISGDLDTLENTVVGLSIVSVPILRSDINTISGDLNALESQVLNLSYVRESISGATSLLSAITGTDTLNITGYNTYALFKIGTNAKSWIRVYSDTASRTADLTRSESVDPLPNSGIIAEVITTGAETVTFTPAVIGFNNETDVTNNIPLSVTNKEIVSTSITVTLTLLRME